MILHTNNSDGSYNFVDLDDGLVYVKQCDVSDYLSNKNKKQKNENYHN